MMKLGRKKGPPGGLALVVPPDESKNQAFQMCAPVLAHPGQ